MKNEQLLVMEFKEASEYTLRPKRSIVVGLAMQPDFSAGLQGFFGPIGYSFTNPVKRRENILEAVYVDKGACRIIFVVLPSKKVVNQVNNGNFDIGIVEPVATVQNVTLFSEIYIKGEKPYSVILSNNSSEEKYPRGFIELLAQEITKQNTMR